MDRRRDSPRPFASPPPPPPPPLPAASPSFETLRIASHGGDSRGQRPPARALKRVGGDGDGGDACVTTLQPAAAAPQQGGAAHHFYHFHSTGGVKANLQKREFFESFRIETVNCHHHHPCWHPRHCRSPHGDRCGLQPSIALHPRHRRHHHHRLQGSDPINCGETRHQSSKSFE